MRINGYGRQSPENLFVQFKRGNDVLSYEIVQAHVPRHRGLLFTGSRFFPLRVILLI